MTAPGDAGHQGQRGDPRTLVVASRNRGKLVEIAKLLAGRPPSDGGGGAAGNDDGAPGFALVTIDALAPDAALVEDGDTFEANALAKARQAAAATGHPAIADDSGLEVDALGGAPGVYSARYAGLPSDDARNNAKLLEALREVPAGAARRARFRCVAAFVDPARGIEIVRSGACEGEVLPAPRGSGGFGYDPLFLVPSLGRTMAELDLDHKNQLSHRAIAFRALAEALRVLGAGSAGPP